jgi:polyferredoxin
MRPRLIGYAAVLTIMIGGLIYAMVSRTAFELDISRDRGALYQITPNDTVANSYTINMMNMTQGEKTYQVKIEGLEGFITDTPKEVTLHSNELRSYNITIEIDPEKLTQSKTNIDFVIFENGSKEETTREESRFIAPIH